jgi:hypothetical protein
MPTSFAGGRLIVIVSVLRFTLCSLKTTTKQDFDGEEKKEDEQ